MLGDYTIPFLHLEGFKSKFWHVLVVAFLRPSTQMSELCLQLGHNHILVHPFCFSSHELA